MPRTGTCLNLDGSSKDKMSRPTLKRSGKSEIGTTLWPKYKIELYTPKAKRAIITKISKYLSCLARSGVPIVLVE